jgi:DNA invertase Pin-like site-specific DNA recombinase
VPDLIAESTVYVRVSSKSQSEASQLPDLRRWAAAQAGGAAVGWARDSFTGKTLARPGWQKVWEGVLAGRVRRVVVWRLDRLGRTTPQLSALFEELTRRGVTLVSLREGFDLSTPGGRLFANLLASVAQYETEVRSERQLAGIAAAKQRGVKFGRPKGEGGRPGKRLKVTPEQETAVRRLKAEGTKVAAIARATGLSRPTVYSVLKGPVPGKDPGR